MHLTVGDVPGYRVSGSLSKATMVPQSNAAAKSIRRNTPDGYSDLRELPLRIERAGGAIANASSRRSRLAADLDDVAVQTRSAAHI